MNLGSDHLVNIPNITTGGSSLTWKADNGVSFQGNKIETSRRGWVAKNQE